MLDRYNAFLIGDLYRDRLIQLTRRRTQEDGFLQTLILTAQCEPGNDVTINRNVVLGPSRIVRLGVGASTDQGAKFRAILRQSRIGSSASSAEARADLSYLNELVNQQVADARFRWYYARGEARSFIEPAVIFEHLAEQATETESIQTKVAHGWAREFTSGQLQAKAGPTILQTFQPRGSGPKRATTTYAEGNLRWTEHDFEWFASSPRTGDYVDATLRVTNKNWGANFTAQQVQIQGQKLWNIFRTDPPLLILGMRYNLRSVFSPDDDITSDLPVQFLTFMGGEGDLRGFDRQSLPRSQIGALSGATTSFEARLHKVIFKRADVFAFTDVGMLGKVRFQLEKPVFVSPGVGVRWESPFGTLRGYVAHRGAYDTGPNDLPYDRALRLGFTFGEEF